MCIIYIPKKRHCDLYFLWDFDLVSMWLCDADLNFLLISRFQAFDSDGNTVAIEAKNFQVGGTLQYTVYESGVISTRFAVEEGKVKTLRTLDYESDPHQFLLTVRALDTVSKINTDVPVNPQEFLDDVNTCWDYWQFVDHAPFCFASADC